MRSRTSMWLLALLLLGSGCDQRKRLDEMQKRLDSWAATLELCARHWNAQRLPQTALRQLVKSAEKSLQEDENRLAKISAQPQRRDELHQRLADLRHRLEELSQAMKKHDRQATIMIRKEDPPAIAAAGGRS